MRSSSFLSRSRSRTGARRAPVVRAASRCLAAVLCVSMLTPLAAQPLTVLPGTGPVTAEQLWQSSPGGVAAQGNAAAEQARERLHGALDRADVASALAQRGLSVERARERVAALTDAEALQLAQRLDELPAGAGGGEILSALIFIFVLLLVTDILGLTKVFPFTRSVR